MPVENRRGADLLLVTLAVMPTPRQRRRVQRSASLVLGVTSGLVTSTNIVIIAASRWNVLTDGTLGMPSVLALVVDAMPYAPIAAIAAVILAGAANDSPTAAAAPIDAIPWRLPMVVAIIACCLLAAYCVFPAFVIVGWLWVGTIGVFDPPT